MRVTLLFGVLWLAACGGGTGGGEEAAETAGMEGERSAAEGAATSSEERDAARAAGSASGEEAIPRDPEGRALLALPEELRQGARVLVLRSGQVEDTLRAGEGPFTCLADDPEREGFHVACYHRSLEPYMARGRELEAEGVTGSASMEARWEEIEAGRLSFPDHPAALYSLTGDAPPSSADEEGPRRLTVLYVAYAQGDTLGLPTRPGAAGPWLMFPGKPTAHVMIGG